MKVIFLARELESSKLIADLLLRKGWADKIIFETGSVARKSKLKRMIWRKPRWRLVLLPLDILFLIWMTRKANQLFHAKHPHIPSVEPALRVEDANEERCVEFLRREQPDFILIYGTAILKKPVLSIPRLGVVNIHGGLVPKYRNVHGEFWAVAHHNFHELGTSILLTDEGVDTGGVVSQRTLGIHTPVSVSEAKLLVFEETLRLLEEVMPELRRESVAAQKQPPYTGTMFQTPTFFDWLRHRVPL